MYACSFNKFHNTRYENTISVAYGIDLNLFASNVFINKHRLVLVNLHGGFEVVSKCFFFCNNLHSSSAEYEARTDKNGIAYLARRSDSGFNARHRLAFWLGNVQFFKQLFKQISVLGACYRIASGAYDVYTERVERFGKVYRSLTAERGYHPDRLLKFKNIHYVLNAERLKIELVRAGVIRGYGFGIVVNDNGFIACRLDGLNGVNGGIGKFYSLTDTNGT